LKDTAEVILMSEMWGIDDAITNGACLTSETEPSAVIGITQCNHNNVPTVPAVASCCLSSTSENNADIASSECTNEKTSLLKCVTVSTSSEALDISCSHATSVYVDSRLPVAASVNYHSATRTSRCLYGGCVTDDDAVRNVPSTPNGDTGHVYESVCSDYVSSNGVDLRSSFPWTSVNETVYSDSCGSHVSSCPINGGHAADQQVSVAAEVSDSNSTIDVDLTDTSAVIAASTELCDDGYMDEMDVLASVDTYQHDQSTAWFVETDTCLDDFIDADMPHNSAVAGSPLSGSLSSIHDETDGVPGNGGSDAADRVTDDVINLWEADVPVNSQRQLHDNLQRSSEVEEHESVVGAFRGLDGFSLNGSRNEHAAYRRQPSDVDSYVKTDSSVMHACEGTNIQARRSNPASESSHDTPPLSLLSPSDDYYSSAGNAELVTNEAVFEESELTASGNTVRKSSDTLETFERQSGARHNQSYWLPIATESESDFPKFCCWSCFEVMNSASLNMPVPVGHVPPSRPRPTDVMSRSATADYSGHDHSEFLTDVDEDLSASVLSARMFSSLTL